jgi:hypothetical protein
MRSLMKRTALVTAACLVTAVSAEAQFLSGGNISGCGGNAFVSCATWSAIASGNSLIFTITNTSNIAPGSNTNSTFTDIGLGNVASIYTLASGGFSAVGYGSWSFSNNLNGYNGFNLTADTFGGNSDPGNPQLKGLTDGNTVTFTFTFTQAINPADFLSPQVAIHDQGAYDGCGNSSKAVFNGNTGALAFDGTTCGMSTVPEPSSMALLGTGLMSLVPMFRRRNRK